jgi:hypothetical protein
MPISPLLVERYAMISVTAALPVTEIRIEGVVAYAAEGGFAASFTGQVESGVVRLRPSVGWPLPTAEVAVSAGSSTEVTELVIYAEAPAPVLEVAQPAEGAGLFTLSVPLSRGGDDFAIEAAAPIADALAVLRSHPVSVRRAGHRCWPELGSHHHALRLATPDTGLGLSVALAALEEALPLQSFSLSGTLDNMLIEVST